MATSVDTKTASILLILVALLVGYAGYSGAVIELAGVQGIEKQAARAQALKDTVTLLEAQIDSAKRDLAKGSVEDVRRRTEAFRSSLRLLRRLVPEKNEVPDLLDEISTRARRRGVAIASVQPQPVELGPAPFDTYKYSMAVRGTYDAIGQFLGDIASLNRIVVPFDLGLVILPIEQARLLGAEGTLLEAKFQIRTFVKSQNPEVDGNGT